jgi:hypothetical protein
MENTTLSSVLHPRILNLKLTYATGEVDRLPQLCSELWEVHGVNIYNTNIFRSFKKHSGLKWNI